MFPTGGGHDDAADTARRVVTGFPNDVRDNDNRARLGPRALALPRDWTPFLTSEGGNCFSMRPQLKGSLHADDAGACYPDRDVVNGIGQ